MRISVCWIFSSHPKKNDNRKVTISTLLHTLHGAIVISSNWNYCGTRHNKMSVKPGYANSVWMCQHLHIESFIHLIYFIQLRFVLFIYSQILIAFWDNIDWHFKCKYSAWQIKAESTMNELKFRNVVEKQFISEKI